MSDKSPNPVGRPTKYREEYCGVVVALGRQGKSLVQMAVELDVTRDTVYEWAKKHSAFSDALDRAREASVGFWTEKLAGGVDKGKDFNDRAARFLMSSLFPDHFAERREVKHSGAIGHVDLNRLPDAALERIAAGEDMASVLASMASEGLKLLGAGGSAEEPETVEEADWELADEGNS